MAYITVVVLSAAVVAGFFLSRYLLGVLSEAQTSRSNIRSTVEGLSIRAHQAAEADRERARASSEVAQAARDLAQQAAEVQDALALERKLRKAISTTRPLLETAEADSR